MDKYIKASTDAWNYFKQHIEISDSDEYWDSVVTKATEAVKPYEGTDMEDFVRASVLLYVDELTRKWKRERKAA